MIDIQVKKHDFEILLEYLDGLKGATRDRAISHATNILHPKLLPAVDPDSVIGMNAPTEDATTPTPPSQLSNDGETKKAKVRVGETAKERLVKRKRAKKVLKTLKNNE